MPERLTRTQTIALLQQVKGIGPALAGRIWSRYGERTAEIAATAPEQLASDIRGLSLRKAHDTRELFMRRGSETRATRESGETTPHPAQAAAAIPGENQPDELADAEEGLLNMDQVRAALGNRWQETYQRRRHAEEVFSRHFSELMQRPNVSGVHVGFRRRRSNDNRSLIAEDLECCIRVHVVKKLPPHDARFADSRLATRLPKSIEGIGVDVLERSYVTLDPPSGLSQSFHDDADTAKPLVLATGSYESVIVGGIGIASKEFPTNEGTLGGIVFSGFQARLLTNQHVAGGVGSVVQQPANGQTPNGKSAKIGTVIDAEIPRPGRPSSLDCAVIAPVTGGRPLDQTIKNIGPPDRFDSGVLTSPDVHRRHAFKIGAVTDRTDGIVKSVNTVVSVGGIMMPHQIVVESEDGSVIIKAGDSGSLLLTIADDGSVFRVVGLIHARSADGTAMVATHFYKIEERFGIKVTL